MSYYELYPDDEQWVLGPADRGDWLYDYDIWMFSGCRPANNAPNPVPFVIDRPARVVDFNSTVFGAIVVSRRLAELLRGSRNPEKYEFHPARVAGSPGEWEVLNLLDCVDCIDHSRSLISYHSPDHKDKPNKPHSVNRLVVRGDAVEGHDLFRVSDWEFTVLASENLKRELEAASISGIEYWPLEVS